MYYTIYKVTNQINGKFYIGSHKTKDLDDGYMGSGKYLRHAQEKYGVENFKKEILFVFDTAEEMYAKEAEIVNEDFLATENTYNLKIGGFGGWDYINTHRDKDNTYGFHKWSAKDLAENGKKLFENKIGIHSLDEETKIKNLKLASEALKEKYPHSGFYKKSHTVEHKTHMSNIMKEKQQGEKNSQYGTRWIFSLALKMSKKIKKDDPLPEGWCEGRKMKF